jgi:ribosomal protein S18 acetylase RimI-like enzyme
MRLTDEQKNENVLNRILEINRECFPSVRASDEKLTRLFRTQAVFVSYRPHEVTGFAICEQFVPEEARLVIIAVDGAWRRQGIGRYLLDEVVEFYTMKRAEFLSLTVNVNNAEAINLYEANDFKRIAVMKRYFLQDGDGVLMRREL